MRQLHDDAGARSVIAAQQDSLVLIETGERGVILDVDDPGAFAGTPGEAHGAVPFTDR